MAKLLKRRTNTKTFEWAENEIVLRNDFERLDALSEAVGMDGIEYIQAVTNARELTEVFYHLQFETEYDRAEIYDAFFSNVSDMLTQEFQKRIAVLIGALMGGDEAKILAAFDQLEEENAPKKEQD
jgi:hypothetical protein